MADDNAMMEEELKSLSASCRGIKALMIDGGNDDK